MYYFLWGPDHIETFSAIKKEITSALILKYYDLGKPSPCKQMQAAKVFCSPLSRGPSKVSSHIKKNMLQLSLSLSGMEHRGVPPFFIWQKVSA